MTITVTKQHGQGGIPQMGVQSFTSDGNAATLSFGFRPARVTVYNETDTIQWIWVRGMASTKVVKVNGTGPAVTTDTGTAILDNQDGTVTLSSGLCGTSKVIIAVAEA